MASLVAVDRILCAGSKANTSLPALVILPSLSYSNRVVPCSLVGAVGQVTGAVVVVAAFDGIKRCYSVLICLGLLQVV